MKKIAAILIAGLVILSVPLDTSAVPLMTETIVSDYYFTYDDHTYMYASIVDFYEDTPDLWSGGVWIGNSQGFEPSLSWSHTLPEGLQVPPDAVLKAKIKIDGEYVDTDGNMVSIQGTWEWDPLEHMWQDNTIYSLTDVDQAGFWNGGQLDMSILAGEYNLRIDEAVLMMDYAYAAPEPATLLLVGFALAGGLAYRRVRRS